MSPLSCLLLFLTLFAASEQGKVKVPTGDYNVEVYFVIDEKSLETYMKEENNDKAKAIASMTGDLNYFITEVNKLYSSMFETKIMISVRELDFISGSTYQSKNIKDEGKVEEDAAIADFDDWLKTTGAKAKYKYDAAILFTGYDLGTKKDASTVGYAHFAQICGELSTGIVEFDKTYNTVGTTAHEIAHILGADHDGAYSSYVMAPSTNHDQEDRWWFSLCSAGNVWKVINKLKENCMLKKSPDSTVPNAGVTPTLMDPNKMCKRVFGSNDYYFSHYKNEYNNNIPMGDNVCRRFYCGKKADDNLYPIYTSDGMPCAKGKTCKEGTCQDDPNSKAAAAVKDDKCVFGDQELVSYEEISCAAVVAEDGKVISCYIGDWFMEKCCATYSTLNCAQYTDASCPKDKPIKCANSANCLHHSWMCDNENDCGDNWDESKENCPTTSNKRSLIDILLDKTLDKRGMIAALESLRDKTIKEDIQDEAPKTPIPEPNQGKAPEKEEFRGNIA